MVGYQKNDTMTHHQKLIAGCVSGAVTRFMTQPLDVIKVRTQLQKQDFTKDKRWFKTTRKILGEEGVTAFWQGHNLGQIHSILSVSSQFYTFELATKFAARTSYHQDYKPIFDFLCGIFAGCCSCTLVIPLEVIRVRQMLVKDQYRGMLKGAKEVYSSGGVLAFYEGLTASLLQMGPAVGISFSVFTFVQPLLLYYLQDCKKGECKPGDVIKHTPENIAVASSIAGSVAGFVSKTLTYPFDLAKRRLQIASHKEKQEFVAPSTASDLAKCTQLTNCIMNTYKEEGLRGLYRGWKVTMYRAQLTHKERKEYVAPSTANNLLRCTHLTNCIIHTFKVEGLRGLYRGWKVTMYKAQMTSIFAFTTYELMCYSIREH